MNAIKRLRDKYYSLNRPVRLIILTISIFIPIINMFSMVYIVYKILVKIIPKYRSLNSKLRLGILFGVFIILFIIGIANPPAEVNTPKPEPEPKEIEQNINDSTATEEVKVEVKEETPEEKEARVKQEQEEARVKQEQEEARVKQEQEEARVKQEQEEARVKQEQEEARVKQEQEEARVKQEQEEARKKELSKQFSAWNGEHIKLTKLIKEKMHNPDSYKHVETYYSIVADLLVINTKFRGTNLFGAIVTNEATGTATIDGQDVQLIGIIQSK